ncbi:hypothetical protein AURDEDRAFT_126351 [Auricularia subglabra TFB-10046 SS5]|nr:hypothetical protein AURDEDRAFT_126351 [Auricularia subglabra TFB-10046 SS5]
MKFSLVSAVALIAAPAAVSAVCCIGAGPPPIFCGLVVGDGPGSSVDMQNAIFNADVYVPEGAKNVLTNSTFGALAICCCSADNPLACRARWCGLPFAFTVFELTF